MYVVVVVASDGTPSVVGCSKGRPFMSEERAESQADDLREHDIHAFVLPLERGTIDVSVTGNRRRSKQ